MGLAKHRYPGRIAGFTLIELLVALILLSVLFLLLTSGLGLGIEIWGKKGEQSNASEVQTAQKLLRQLLSEARPTMIQGSVTQKTHVFFFGTKNSIRFVAPMPKYVTVGGFYDVAVYLTDAKRVEISWRLFRRNGATSGHATLLNNVSDIEFAYFGAREKNESARWRDSWHGAQFLPELIRLRIKFNRGSQPWPAFFVAPILRSVAPLRESFSFR